MSHGETEEARGRHSGRCTRRDAQSDIERTLLRGHDEATTSG